METRKFVTILATAALTILVSAGCRSKADAKAEVAAKTPSQPVAKTVQNDDFVNPNRPSRETDTEQLEEITIEDAFFALDSSSLTYEAREALARSAAWLEQNRGHNVVIEGHCDERGTQQYNLALGERRAAAARDYLVSLGVDVTRVSTTSLGEERPFVTGSSEEAWAQNRRAHLVANTR